MRAIFAHLYSMNTKPAILLEWRDKIIYTFVKFRINLQYEIYNK